MIGMSVGGNRISAGTRGRLLLATASALLLVLGEPVSAPVAEPRFGSEYGDREGGGSALSPESIDGWRADTSAASENGGVGGMRGQDVREMLDAANAAQARGHLEIAQRLFEQVIAKDPGSAEAVVARRQLGAIYRGELAAPASRLDAAREADPAITGAPLPDLPDQRSSGSIDITAEGIRPADLVAGERDGLADAREAAVATPMPPAVADVPISPQPWRARGRQSHRFEQLLRADVGDRIFFGTGSAQIGSRARGVLERQAEWLSRYPDLFVVVEGHSDEPGSEVDNDAIARQRAETARRLLIGAGMKPERVDIDVRGRKDPVATCESSDCRSQNRRAVIRLMVVLPARAGDRSSLDDVPFHRIPPW
ncbi:MAG: OmpA family protein [Hyphomicrobiaceae bacterium]